MNPLFATSSRWQKWRYPVSTLSWTRYQLSYSGSPVQLFRVWSSAGYCPSTGTGTSLDEEGTYSNEGPTWSSFCSVPWSIQRTQLSQLRHQQLSLLGSRQRDHLRCSLCRIDERCYFVLFPHVFEQVKSTGTRGRMVGWARRLQRSPIYGFMLALLREEARYMILLNRKDDAIRIRSNNGLCLTEYSIR